LRRIGFAGFGSSHEVFDGVIRLVRRQFLERCIYAYYVYRFTQTIAVIVCVQGNLPAVVCFQQHRVKLIQIITISSLPKT
jgi:hypothetical protein